ncbi:MAG: class I SAM-dependent methyltransferase [Mesorhizobium sp.]
MRIDTGLTDGTHARNFPPWLEDEMSNLETVRDEFGRQAETFDRWAVKTDEKSGERFIAALGNSVKGAVLDVACGPGVVTAAVAPHATSVTAFDATEAMIGKARARCEAAGLANVVFRIGDAHDLPFETGQFDGVVSRLAVHHFTDPGRAIGEMARVLKPGGMLVVADITVSDDKADADLQNAIEILRDPSHVAMLPQARLVRHFRDAGLEVVATESWDKEREFGEWMGIVNDASRLWPLQTVVAALTEAGRDAGMGLRMEEGRIRFFHRWCLVSGRKATG